MVHAGTCVVFIVGVMVDKFGQPIFFLKPGKCSMMRMEHMYYMNTYWTLLLVSLVSRIS